MWSPPWHLYIFLLANLLAFYLIYFLTFYLAYLLVYFLAYLLAFYLAYILAFILTFFFSHAPFWPHKIQCPTAFILASLQMRMGSRLFLYWPVPRYAKSTYVRGWVGRRLVVGLPWGCCVSRSPKGGSRPSMLVVVEAGRWRRLHAKDRMAAADKWAAHRESQAWRAAGRRRIGMDWVSWRDSNSSTVAASVLHLP